MAGKPLGPNDVRVNVRGAGKGGRSLRYTRALAGLKFGEALKKLDSNDDPASLSKFVSFRAPFFLNGKEIDKNSDVVLKAGDTISLTDP